MILRSKLIAVLLVLTSTVGWSLEDYEMTRDMYEAFPLGEETTVEIENKYGDVYIETWEKDSVAFEIEIVAYAEKDEFLEELLDLVEIDFKSYSTFIIAKTEIGESQNLLDKAGFFISKKIAGTKEVRVNYRVFLPTETALSIENEFGDIYIDEYLGEIDIDLSHGELRANLLADIQSIKIRYGEVKIDEASGGRLNLGFVKGAELGLLSDVFIKSSSSEIDIEEIDVLKLESRLDEIYIESLGELAGKTTMTKVHVKYLMDGADLESKYGNVRIEELMPTATKVKMNGTNTDYAIDLSADASGTFEIQMSSSKNLSSSTELVKVKDQIALDDKTNRYEGKLTGGSGDVRIQMITKNGDVELGM